MGLDEGGVTMTSPTQPQEKYMGFDAMAGLPSGRYALLQFKRPSVASADSMRFTIGGDQLYALLRYPPRSAFYVLPPIDSEMDMWEAKASLLGRSRLIDAWDFLAALMRHKPASSCLLDFARIGPADWPQTHTVRVGRHGGATSIYARLPRGKYREVCQRPVSCLCCDHDGLGFLVAGGKVRAWNGMEWGGIGRSRSAEDALAVGVLKEWLDIGCDGKRSARGAGPGGRMPGAAAPPLDLHGEDRRQLDLPLPGGRDAPPLDEFDDERRPRSGGGANARGGSVFVRIGDTS